MKKTKALILVPELSNCDIADFRQIADNIHGLASDIRVHIVKRRHLWWRQLAFLFQPSLYVAFYEAKRFKPVRGLCLRGQSIGKSKQYKRMELAGIDVIAWKSIDAETRYQRKDWGDMVIVKPDHGREGRGVHLSRPEKIDFAELSTTGQTYLIQKFIDTGESPNYFRALTLFGETLYLRKTTNHGSTGNAENIEALPNPVANAAQGSSELVHDEEVMEFARIMAAKAFPEIPLLGQDIVRDRESGKLFCLEVNPYGSTWHFSTETGKSLQLRDGIDYRKQFDAFNLAARILVEQTRKLAR